jgi:hypothetical protein
LVSLRCTNLNAEAQEIWLGQKARPYFKNREKRAPGMAQVVECLNNKRNALSSTLILPIKNDIDLKKSY